MEGAAVSTSDAWVIDATQDPVQNGLYCFYPYNRDTDTVAVGLTFLGELPPGRLVGVYHTESEEAAVTWAKEHEELLRNIVERTNERDSNKEA